MATYTKKWIPPSIPLRDDLPAWKLICNDIHQNIIDSGIVHVTDGVPNLDIDAVAVLPTDGTFAGSKTYRFNDTLQATKPVFFRLEFGCGYEGLGSGSGSYVRSRTIRISVVVSDSQNFTSTSVKYQCPQNIQFTGATGVSQLTRTGNSFICSMENYFMISYGNGSRNFPKANSVGEYVGSSLFLLIFRTNDSISMSSVSQGGIVNAAFTVGTFLKTTGISSYSYSTSTWSVDQTRNTGHIGSNLDVDRLSFSPAYYLNQDRGTMDRLPMYSYKASMLPMGNEVTLEVSPGVFENYVALGNETGLGVDSYVFDTYGFAVKFGDYIATP